MGGIKILTKQVFLFKLNYVGVRPDQIPKTSNKIQSLGTNKSKWNNFSLFNKNKSNFSQRKTTI